MPAENSRLTNVEFEHVILGAALRHEESREQILSNLNVQHFSTADNKALFDLLHGWHHDGQPIDLNTTLHGLRKDPTFHNDAGQYLAMVTQTTCTPSSLPWYLERLSGYRNARSLTKLGINLSAAAQMTDGDPGAVAEALQGADHDLMDATASMIDAPWDTIGHLASAVGSDERPDPVVTTGFYDVDDMLMGGLRPGQLVAIAARPGQGKSTFAVDIARNTSIHHGRPGLLISLEMGGHELASRILSAESQVSLRNITQWTLQESDEPKLHRAQDRILNSPLYVIDDIEPALPQIRGAIIAAKRRLDINYVIIDYLQLITSDGMTHGSNASRQDVVANVSRALKALARSLDIAVIIVAQLNRSSEQRADKTPMTSDMRESGQIEQDCDIIFLLFRPDYYDQNDRPGEADVHVAKQRNGRTGILGLAFRGHFAQFSSMHRDPEPAGGANPYQRA